MKRAGGWQKSEVIGSKRIYSPVPTETAYEAEQLGSSFPLEELLDSDGVTMPSAILEPNKPKESDKHEVMISKEVQSKECFKHESVIVSNRLGFDEGAFRQRLHQQQAELSAEFKQSVEALYDAMDGMVAEVSREMYQQQQEQARELESLIADIKQSTLQTGNRIFINSRISGSFDCSVCGNGPAGLLPDLGSHE